MPLFTATIAATVLGVVYSASKLGVEKSIPIWNMMFEFQFFTLNFGAGGEANSWCEFYSSNPWIPQVSNEMKKKMLSLTDEKRAQLDEALGILEKATQSRYSIAFWKIAAIAMFEQNLSFAEFVVAWNARFAELTSDPELEKMLKGRCISKQKIAEIRESASDEAEAKRLIDEEKNAKYILSKDLLCEYDFYVAESVRKTMSLKDVLQSLDDAADAYVNKFRQLGAFLAKFGDMPFFFALQELDKKAVDEIRKVILGSGFYLWTNRDQTSGFLFPEKWASFAKEVSLPQNSETSTFEEIFGIEIFGITLLSVHLSSKNRAKAKKETPLKNHEDQWLELRDFLKNGRVVLFGDFNFFPGVDDLPEEVICIPPNGVPTTDKERTWCQAQRKKIDLRDTATKDLIYSNFGSLRDWWVGFISDESIFGDKAHLTKSTEPISSALETGYYSQLLPNPLKHSFDHYLVGGKFQCMISLTEYEYQELLKNEEMRDFFLSSGFPTKISTEENSVIATEESAALATEASTIA